MQSLLFAQDVGQREGGAWAQDKGLYDAAEAMCMRLMEFGAPAKEKAKALLREIRQFQVRVRGIYSLMLITSAQICSIAPTLQRPVLIFIGCATERSQRACDLFGHSCAHGSRRVSIIMYRVW
jgi:hypothetical protein